MQLHLSCAHYRRPPRAIKMGLDKYNKVGGKFFSMAGPPPSASPAQGTYFNAASAYTQEKSVFIYFYSPVTGHQVYFEAFLEQLSDSFSPEWNTEHIFGRGDPIYNYAGTTRKISLSWMLVAGDSEEGLGNVAKANKLITFMYPVYSTDRDDAMTSPPIVRVKFTNLIQNVFRPEHSEGEGLACAIDSLTWDPDIEAGFFDGDTLRGYRRDILIPKVLRISVNLTVMHEHLVGWAWSGDPPPFGDPYEPDAKNPTVGNVHKQNLGFGPHVPGEDKANLFPSIPRPSSV